MRIAAQAKCGYYPAHESAIDEFCQYIKPAFMPGSAVCDPCAGCGDAVLQIAARLQMTPWAIELDEGRAATLRKQWDDAGHDQANVLAPASIFGCSMRGRGFALMWLNPPYDDELGGGGREETAFLNHAAGWLCPGGILAFVVPERQAGAYAPSRSALHTMFDDLVVMPFPQEVRNFNEVIVIGRRRVRSERHEVVVRQVSHVLPRITPGVQYELPETGTGPSAWTKWEPTELELGRMLDKSPLNRLFQSPPDRPPPRPPLPLAKGHVALLLASGHLDGLVKPPDEPAHLIRGTVRKEQYLAETTEDENADGSITTKQVFRERQILKVRALTQQGIIHDFE